MPEPLISKAALKRLQTLWSKYAAWRVTSGQWPLESKGDEAREERLAWLSNVTSRPVASSKSLTVGEARTAIDELQKLLPPELVQHRRRGRTRDRDLARAQGREGRRGYRSNVTHLPDAQTLALIGTLRAQLEWGDVQFQSWLRSKYSPTGGATRIDTMGQANAVISGLKRMLRHKAKLATEAQRAQSREAVHA